MQRELPLRITVLHPPPGVTFRLQRGQGGKADLVAPTSASAERLTFDLTVRVGNDRQDGPPRLLGPFAQGPPASRFVYVNSGTLAGQAGSCFTRRAKVHLAGISWQLIEEAMSKPDAALEARIRGAAKDGGPACATVPLLDGGWKVAVRSSGR
ncbi:MAG TPA: DUF5990 family protein [Thermoanaerobaculia bacterium]